MACDFVCILSVIAIEFFSRTSSKELPTKAAIALNHTIYALRFFLRMHCSGTAFCDWTHKKKKKTNPNLYLGSYLRKARVIRDKLLTLIYFVIVQCPSVGTTWYSASCARNGYTWAARDLRLPRRTSGSALSADCQTLDVFVIVKVLFRIPQQLIIVKIRK